MPLRKLTIEIELPTSSTGRRAKYEHARLLKGILYMLETEEWGAFATPLFDTLGNRVGKAMLAGTSPLLNPEDTMKDFADGNRQQTAA